MQSVVTSPPYWWMRDYSLPEMDLGGDAGVLGLEPTPDGYARNVARLMSLLRPSLAETGTVMLNIADSYVTHLSGGGQFGKKGRTGHDRIFARKRPGSKACGLPEKNLIGLPWRVASLMQADGWWWRQTIVWSKPNPRPDPAGNRCAQSHEYVLLFSKGKNGLFKRDALKSVLGTDGSVWTIPVRPGRYRHWAPFPVLLAEACIAATTDAGDTVLDPLAGTGTTGVAAAKLGRKCVLMEANGEYCELMKKRITETEKGGILTNTSNTAKDTSKLNNPSPER